MQRSHTNHTMFSSTEPLFCVHSYGFFLTTWCAPRASPSFISKCFCASSPGSKNVFSPIHSLILWGSLEYFDPLYNFMSFCLGFLDFFLSVAYINHTVLRLEGNLSCQFSPSTVSETRSLVCPCIPCATWPMTFWGHTPPSYSGSTGITAACLEEVRGSFKERGVWKRNNLKSCDQQARLPIGSGHLNSWHHTPTEIAFTHWVPAVSSQKICLGLYCGKIKLVSIFIKAWTTNPRHTSQ